MKVWVVLFKYSWEAEDKSEWQLNSIHDSEHSAKTKVILAKFKQPFKVESWAVHGIDDCGELEYEK